jgi:hypothetical protein
MLGIIAAGTTVARLPVIVAAPRAASLAALWPPHQRVRIEEPIPTGGKGEARVRISNRGGAPLEFSVAPGPHASASTGGGRLEPREAREVSVTVSPDAVAPGASGTARIEITAGDGRALADIAFTRAREPKPVEDMVEIHDEIVLSHAQEWGELKVDRSVMDLPLKVAGKACARGLGTHARSETVWDLGGAFRRFRALVGVDDGAAPGGRPEVILRVSLDRGGGWEAAWESPRKKLGDPPSEIDIDVTGARKLRLEGDPAGDFHWDHIDIIEPRLER